MVRVRVRDRTEIRRGEKRKIEEEERNHRAN